MKLPNNKFTALNKIYPKRGFSLIELMVVISIVAILSAVGIVAYVTAQKSARDSKRKQDLNAIKTALELYYNDNKKYPKAGACNYGSNCYVYSTQGSGESWIPDLVNNGYMQRMPKDPINNGPSPWFGTYSYAYGNVGTNGQGYDLVANLENVKDQESCARKGWKGGQYDDPTAGFVWCTSKGGNYVDTLYEASPDR